MLSTTIWWDSPMPRHSRRVGRHHRRAQLDLGHLAADDGERGQRVVPEDLRHPERVEALLGAAPRLVDEVVERAPVDRGTHGSQSHAPGP
jgi:hypothetical protein